MKWLISIGLLFTLVVAGLLMAPSFYDWNQYKEPAIAQIEEMTGYDVSINGDISLALLPSPRVYAEDVRIEDPVSTAAEAAPLLAFDLLDVRVALAPLLSGKVSVTSINLNKPQINVSQNADGEFNFMTDKLKAMSEGKEQADSGKDASAFDVSFDTVRVYDGQVSYTTPDQDEPLKLNEIELVLNGESLNGPFKATGSLNNQSHVLGFEAQTGEIDMETMSGSLNLRADVGGLGLQFAGVVSGGDAPEIQGETSLLIDSLSKMVESHTKESAPSIPNVGVSVGGLLTANAEKAALKNAELKLGNTTLTGAVEAELSPIGVNAKFDGKDILDLDQWLRTTGSASAGGGAIDPAALGAVLPKTLEIPVLGNIKIELALPGVTYDGHVYKSVALQITNTEKSFAGKVSADNLPGQGRVEAQGALSFAEKSVSQKTNTAIYSDPVAAFSVQGQAQKFSETLNAFADVKAVPIIKDTRVGIFDVKGSLRPSGLAVEKATINLDDLAVSASGAWTGQKDSKRSLLKATVVADSLNLDPFLADSDTGQSSGDPLAALKGFSLPFDADIDVTLNKTTIKEQPVQGARAAVIVKPNNLRIQNIGFQDLAGSSFKLSGTVGDLKALSGLDIQTELKSPNPRKLAGLFNVDTSAWPEALKALDADIKAKGDLQNMDVNAVLSALGGSVTAQGQIAQPMGQMSISGLNVNIKHPSTMKAARIFAPEAPYYSSLEKPMDVSAKVVLDGATSRLNEISGQVAGTSVSGNLAYDSGQAVPVLAGALKVGDLVVKGGSGSSAAQKSSGMWSSEAFDTAFLHDFQVNLDLAANSIVYETWNLKGPAIKIVLQNGKLDLSGVKAGLYDGEVLANATISSASKDAPLSVSSSGVVKNINMGALAKALSGTSRIQTEGDVSLEYNVNGTGKSQRALVEALGGSAKMSGTNVVMKGFDLAGLAQALMESSKPLPRIQQILKSSTSGGETRFDTVAGAYVIENGIVKIDSMTMDGPAAGIVSKGSASLPPWTIDTIHTVTLKNAPEVNPFDIAIKGSLSNPTNTFGSGLFDTFVRQRLQQKAAEKLPDLLGDDVSEKLQKFGILPGAQQQQAPANDNTPSTEPASGEETQQAPRQPTPEEAIGGLINGLLKNR